MLMYYQEDGNGQSNSAYVLSRKGVMDKQEDDNGLWTIRGVSMFYGLQYNEDFYKEKASLYFIYFIL